MNELNYPITPEGYKLIEVIGRGTFNNVVWSAFIPPRDNEQVAIKIFDLEEYSQENLDAIRKEIQIMNRCRDEHIVPYYCSFVHRTKLWLVMKMLAGSCQDVLRYNHPNGIKDETSIAIILRGVIHGLSYLHDQQKLHRDIKAANILLSSEGQVQLSDFGVSAVLDAHDQRRTTFVGTVCYMAPEVLDPSETGGYDHKADLWSLGITAIELAYGKPPYALNQPMKVIVLLLKYPPPSLTTPEHEVKTIKVMGHHQFSLKFQSFVSSCLQKDPRKRLTAIQLLEHPFLATLKKKKLNQRAYLVQDIVDNLILSRIAKSSASSALGGSKLQRHIHRSPHNIGRASKRSSKPKENKSPDHFPTNVIEPIQDPSPLISMDQPKEIGSKKLVLVDGEEELEWDFEDEMKREAITRLVENKPNIQNQSRDHLQESSSNSIHKISTSTAVSVENCPGDNSVDQPRPSLQSSHSSLNNDISKSGLSKIVEEVELDF